MTCARNFLIQIYALISQENSLISRRNSRIRIHALLPQESSLACVRNFQIKIRVVVSKYHSNFIIDTVFERFTNIEQVLKKKKCPLYILIIIDQNEILFDIIINVIFFQIFFRLPISLYLGLNNCSSGFKTSFFSKR